MGTDYSACTYIAVPFTLDDFLTTVEQTTSGVICAHEIKDPSQVFCPTCGTHKDNRTWTKAETVRRPLPHVAHLEPFVDWDEASKNWKNWTDDDEYIDWFDEYMSEYQPKIGKLKVLSDEDLDGLHLGFHVDSTGSNRCGGNLTASTGWNNLVGQVEAFRLSLAEMGITRMPKLYTALDIS